MQWIRSHLSFANLVSLMALFVALGGTTYAAVVLPKNSVKAKQIAKNAVGASEIKRSAVRTGEVRNGSLQSSDFAAGQLPAGAKGDKGDKGDQGIQGIQGVEGPPGTEGPTAFARVQADGSLQPDVAGFPPQNLGVVAANVVKGEGGAATGTYCFNIDFRPASALVSLDNADAAEADRNLVVSIALDRGQDLGDCPATHNDARVRVVDGNAAAAQDARFFVWFQR
jgi:hypothetical protein